MKAAHSARISRLVDKVRFIYRQHTKRRVLTDALQVRRPGPRVLLYYKTDPFESPDIITRYVHTNNAEIVQMGRIFDRFGFTVDIIDRTARWEDIEPLARNEYAVFLSDCSANSTPHHCRILKGFRLGKKIVYGTIMHAARQNEYSQRAHDDFIRRHPGAGLTPRMLLRQEGENEVGDRYAGMDAVIHFGNEFTRATYSPLGIPCFPIVAATSPHIQFRPTEVAQRDPGTFLFYGGSGLVQKGLDLVIDAFLELPGLRLEIMGPAEKDFWQVYAGRIKNAANIRYHGFVSVGSKEFDGVLARTGFLLAPSLYDAGSTSICTVMRKGLIPVVTREAGTEVGPHGVILRERSVEELLTLLPKLAETSHLDLVRWATATYDFSWRYTAESFECHFERALRAILALPKC